MPVERLKIADQKKAKPTNRSVLENATDRALALSTRIHSDYTSRCSFVLALLHHTSAECVNEHLSKAPVTYPSSRASSRHRRNRFYWRAHRAADRKPRAHSLALPPWLDQRCPAGDCRTLHRFGLCRANSTVSRRVIRFPAGCRDPHCGNGRGRCQSGRAGLCGSHWAHRALEQR